MNALYDTDHTKNNTQNQPLIKRRKTELTTDDESTTECESSDDEYVYEKSTSRKGKKLKSKRISSGFDYIAFVV